MGLFQSDELESVGPLGIRECFHFWSVFFLIKTFLLNSSYFQLFGSIAWLLHAELDVGAVSMTTLLNH